VDWQGTYTFVGDPAAREGRCSVVDISRMGTGVELFGDVPVDPIGKLLVVDVRGPAGGSIGIHIEGKVRNATTGSNGGARVGVEFVGLSDVEMSILDSLEQMQIAW
jgi:hypothetical protein